MCSTKAVFRWSTFHFRVISYTQEITMCTIPRVIFSSAVETIVVKLLPSLLAVR